jgi:Fic family protein
LCYDGAISDVAEKKLSKAEVAELRKLRREAMNLQAIEGNPLDAEDIAMFEMFEREGWTHEQRLAYILKAARASADT